MAPWSPCRTVAPCCGLRSNWMLDWANGADPCCEVHVQPARTKILIFSSCSSWVSPTSSYEKLAFSLTLGSFLCRSKSWTWLKSRVPRFSHHGSWLFIHHPSQRGPWPQWTLPNQPTSGPNLRDTTMEWARNYGNIWMLVVLTCFNHLEWEGLYDYPIYIYVSIYEMENNTCSKPPNRYGCFLKCGYPKTMGFTTAGSDFGWKLGPNSGFATNVMQPIV